jgi:RNA polymerase sigma factor (sigma-70 family)
MENHANDIALARECQAGAEGAWIRLQESYRTGLSSLLIGRGASLAEAEDLLSEMWMDLGGFESTARPLLESYEEKGTLKSWLGTVAVNRWITLRRRKSAAEKFIPGQLCEDSVDFRVSPCTHLGEAMRQSLNWAWRNCPPESRVMLQLLHVEKVKQREIARVWGWSESKVSRGIESASCQIQKDTLREISKEQGGYLCWRDFMVLWNRYQSVLFDSAENTTLGEGESKLSDPAAGSRQNPSEGMMTGEPEDILAMIKDFAAGLELSPTRREQLMEAICDRPEWVCHLAEEIKAHR